MLARSTRPQDSTTAAYLFKFLVRIPTVKDLAVEKNTQPVADSQENVHEHAKDVVPGNVHLVVNLLILSLEDQLETAKQSLLHAAATKPMYPTLHCIRYLLAEVQLR